MYKTAQPVVVMYQAHHPVTTSMNGLGGTGSFDDSSTINPNALNTTVPVSTQGHIYDPGPRGHKRSRSPDTYQEGIGGGGGGQGEEEDPLRKKRGRPRKDTKSSLDSPVTQSSHGASRPSSSSQNLSGVNKGIPAVKPPAKTVIKALPTVRDHTTDQLNPEGDEYIPREFDTEGEKKVSQDGRPLGGREYRIRTFLVPNRGDKLFMLATECARILAYRDSYLLFNKNRSLYKIIANQTEKDDLISQEILPYSYRSRQIAIVTARSMFRQFGSRLIVGGRRVRDDYWEAKARKQGFTEEDPAGEKRPGGARAAREAQEAANAANLAHQDIVYNNPSQNMPLDANGIPHFIHGTSGPLGHGLGQPSLPMIRPTEELSMRGDYSGISRPRQEMTGIPYQDRHTPSSNPELLSQSSHAADFNKVVNSQSKVRGKQLNDFYKQSRDITNPGILQPGPESPSASNVQTPSAQSTAGGMMGSVQSSMMGQQVPQMPLTQLYQHQQQPPQQPQSQQSPSLPPPSQHHAASQSPARGMQSHMSHQSGMGYGGANVQQGSYNYSQQSQMWGQPPQQPHQSPVSSQHGLPQYPSQASHGSPHQSQSPHQHSQSQPQPQLQHSHSSGSMHGGMGYPPSVSQLSQYGAQNPMYRPQQTGSPHGYMQHSGAGAGAGMHSWAPPQQGHGQQWSGY